MNGLGGRRWWALGAITLAVMAAGLDATVLSLALPTLTAALHASESQLQWIVTGYTLALAVAMLPPALLGDRFGRKRVMLAALALFGLGSIACAFSTSPEMLIAARVELGIAGAGLTVMALSAVTVLFSEDERPRAIGIWSAANFLALPVGPILGGWMLANFWWGWVFLINVPVVLVGLIAIAVLMPESRSAERPGLDIGGLLTSSAGLSSLMYGLIQAGEKGWGSASAIVPMLAAAVLLAAFVLWEGRLTRQPGGRPSSTSGSSAQSPSAGASSSPGWPSSASSAPSSACRSTSRPCWEPTPRARLPAPAPDRRHGRRRGPGRPDRGPDRPQVHGSDRLHRARHRDGRRRDDDGRQR